MWRLAALLLIVATVACLFAWLLTGKEAYRRWAVRLGVLTLIGLALLFGLLIIGRLST